MFRAPGRIQLICPAQLILGTFAGGAFHGGAERRRRNLQSVHADDVPEGQSKTDHFIGPTVIPCSFTQLIDLSDD